MGAVTAAVMADAEEPVRATSVIPVQAARQGRIALVRCGQGWTGPLGPRSRRIDCMIANVVVLV